MDGVNRCWSDQCSTMAWCILGAAVLMLSLGVDGAGGGSYVAAVYEHRVIRNLQPKVLLSRQEALEHMNKNLDVYEEQAAAAAKQGAHIIVFPEDGIHGFNFSRESIAGYLETVPDPTTVSWNPCSDPARFPNTEVLHRLSCMAKNNSLYLVANMPGREDCDAQTTPCPPDGRYQFNTNVVFSANGTLVARYRKRNLYFEFEFDTPADPQLITFDTPFAGRFGLFTCFDILFYNPAVELVEKLGVRQLIFPTAWMNQLPLLAAVQFHRSFSYATGTSLLSANIRTDTLGMTGSGIFSPWETLHHHAGAGEPEAGRLLVKTLPVLDSLRPDLRPHNPPLPRPFSGDQEPQHCLRGGDECQNTVPEGWGRLEEPAAPSSPFKAEMMYDSFTMVLVEGSEGYLSVCDNALCCHLQFRRRTAPQELYALAAFDGLHVVHGTYYVQACALVRCSGPTPQTCGAEIDHADTLLDFRLMGNFSTPHVFPSVLGSHMQLERPDHSGWGGRGFYMSCRELERGLVTAALYGRAYDRDHTHTAAGGSDMNV
ncbi:biotinidase-like [Anguilla anguilla]|uniref:biotinidase-like n=1 Tax=Anguilla anguilla TaxID=7936 RepID=UPI0015ACFAF7|nr:biotinidase-like [Anguilla anguilla]